MKTFQAHVRDGRIVPDEAVDLPEGAKVRIEILDPAVQAKGTPLEGLHDFLGTFDGLSSDASTSYEDELRRRAGGDAA